MTRRRKILRSISTGRIAPRVENPDVLPAWVFMEPPAGHNAIRLRGGLFFDALEQLGIRVQRIRAGESGNIGVWSPWTYVFLSVPFEDVGPSTERVADANCSVIMDCHFPIMNMERAIGSDGDLADIIDHKDTMLQNLAHADVVTVPQPGWAADLAEVNPNVFLLPDFDIATGAAFSLRMGEIAAASIRAKQARQKARREVGL